MPINRSKRVIFIHIPKTAGESIENKLGMYGANGNPLHNFWGIYQGHVLQHLTAEQIKRVMKKEVFDSCFKFSFVRNPWDKTVSEYHWYLQYGEPLEFKEWIKTLRVRIQSFSNPHLLEVGHNIPQYKFIYDNNGQLLVNYIGRFENLTKDFAFVCQSINVGDHSIPHLKSTSAKQRGGYRGYYDDDTRGLVEAIYHKDIKLFGYEF